MKIKSIYSPNFNKRKRSNNSIKIIIIHYTGMQSERESIDRLCNPYHKVSSHYLINRSGKIYRLVKENYSAWHAGKSNWDKMKNLNKCSIGIELVNKGHEYGYTTFKKKQIESLIKVCKKLIKKYKIKKNYILGHSDIAPLRKTDPGEKFPWKVLSAQKIGFWHNLNSRILKKNRNKKTRGKERLEFIQNIKDIGYYCSLKKKSSIVKNTEAFQRHFRQDLINGYIDKECILIAKNLLKKL